MNYLALAEAALKLGNAGGALQALNAAPVERTGRADWQNLMGRTETALNQFAEAETRFSEAVRLQPANPTYQINLYAIRLQSADRSVAADAERRLQSLAGDEHTGILALRAMLREALQTRVAASLVIDQPEGITGHGGGGAPGFATRFAPCLLRFVTDPQPPTACTPPST